MVEYRDLSFKKTEEGVVATLYNLFEFVIPHDELLKVGEYAVSGNSITFTDVKEEKAQRKMDFFVDKYILHLKNKISGFPSYFIHKGTGIPLMGLNFLGITDKGSEMIEIKPITSCNMNCIFCSVDEGPDSKKQVDFVVEKDYLVEEFYKLMEHKEYDKFQAWINPHGEPTLYAKLVELVADLAKHPKVKDVILITNGTLLNKPFIDELAAAGLTKMQCSISGIVSENAKKMMGHKGYNIEKVLQSLDYAKDKFAVTVTPVYVKGMNDDQMLPLLKYCVDHGLNTQIQKFCTNKFGRNPIKEQKWDEFFGQLQHWQDESGVVLISELGKVSETKQLPKPFKKKDRVEVEIKGPGRMKRDKIGVADDRAVLIVNCDRDKGRVKVEILQSKYNQFLGKVI